MTVLIAPYDHPFYSNFEKKLIKKSNHQKIQEHEPSEWDVSQGKHLQRCSIVPPSTHHTLRLTGITLTPPSCSAGAADEAAATSSPLPPVFLPGK
jgi:hypothetical protein